MCLSYDLSPILLFMAFDSTEAMLCIADLTTHKVVAIVVNGRHMNVVCSPCEWHFCLVCEMLLWMHYNGRATIEWTDAKLNFPLDYVWIAKCIRLWWWRHISAESFDVFRASEQNLIKITFRHSNRMERILIKYKVFWSNEMPKQRNYVDEKTCKGLNYGKLLSLPTYHENGNCERKDSEFGINTRCSIS